MSTRLQNPINLSSTLNKCQILQNPSNNDPQPQDPTLFTLFNTLKLEKPIHPLLCLFIHVYMILQTLSLGLNMDYHWGSYGRTVQHVFISFSSFGVQFLEYYEGFIAILVVAIVWQLVVILLLVATFRASKNGKYFKEIRKASRLAFVIMFFLSGPLTYGMALGFWNCDDSSSSDVMNLRIFPSIPCWNSTNSVLAILSLMVILTQIVTSFMTVTVFCDTFLTSKAFFILEDPYLMSYVTASNQLYIILSIATPYHVMYLRPIYYMIISMIFCVLLLRYLPFIRRRANSFYGGIGMARVGIGIGSLVSSIINPLDEWQNGLVLTFSPIVAGLIGFGLGCVVTELYTFYLLRKGQHILEECIEQMTMSGENPLTPSMDLVALYFNLYSKHVNCLIQSSLKSSTWSESPHHRRRILIEDVLKVIQQQQPSTDMLEHLPCRSLILLSLFLSCSKKNTQKFAIRLLMKAQQKCPSYDYFTRYTISFRLRELHYENGKASVANSEFVLNRVKSNLPKLRKQTYLFWRSVQLGIFNVHEILQEMNSLSLDCETSLHTIMRERDDEDVIKLYASFMEECKFEKVTIEDEFAQKENELLLEDGQNQEESLEVDSLKEEDFAGNQQEIFSNTIRKQVGNDNIQIGLLTLMCVITFLFVMGLVTCDLASTEKHDFNSIMLKVSRVNALPYLAVSELAVLGNTSFGNLTRAETILTRSVEWIDHFENSYEMDVPSLMKQNLNNFSQDFVVSFASERIMFRSNTIIHDHSVQG